MASLIPSANASGTGSMTLAGPSTNSNQTVTIPDTTGTMMVSGNMPAFSAYAGSTQSVTGGANTKLQINTKEFDTANCYDNTTNYRFTPTVAGYYQLNAMVRPNSSNGEAQTQIFKNGASYKAGSNINISLGTNNGSVVSALCYANGTTDYFEVYIYVSNTGTTSSGIQSVWFNGVLVRTA